MYCFTIHYAICYCSRQEMKHFFFHYLFNWKMRCLSIIINWFFSTVTVSPLMPLETETHGPVVKRSSSSSSLFEALFLPNAVYTFSLLFHIYPSDRCLSTLPHQLSSKPNNEYTESSITPLIETKL